MRDELLEVLRELPESKESSTESFLENFKPTRLRRPSRLNWKVGLAAVAALSVVASILLYGLYSGRRAPALTGKDTILIADFTNTTGDAVFDDTLKQGLAMQLRHPRAARRKPQFDSTVGHPLVSAHDPFARSAQVVRARRSPLRQRPGPITARRTG